MIKSRYARHCSKCGYKTEQFMFRYRPNCGARMDGEDNNGRS